MKRKYHVNEISSINSNFSDFSLIINFDNPHSITQKLSISIKKTASAVDCDEEESRQFYGWGGEFSFGTRPRATWSFKVI